LLADRPDLMLSAETGGKNATIVTAMADRDQAIKNVIHSAFSNCGQKCSATSLLILEDEVYQDHRFREQLVDAAASFPVGSAWDFKHRMGPLIRPPAGDLERGLRQLEPGESWALEPRMIDGNPYLWSPGIKWDVQPGSFTHTTELFGPLLGVMWAKDLAQAVELVNATGYGLTSGLESLDRREQAQWKATVRAGNLYINRGTTGAITLRQPFGGMGKSALGPAIKAGSPNYVAQFMDYEETGFPAVDAVENDHALLRLVREWQLKADWGQFGEVAGDIRKTVRAVKSYLYHYEKEFSRETDYFHLRGQDNILRYRPIGRVMIRIHAGDGLFETLARIAAAHICGCDLLLSAPPGLDNAVTEFLMSRDGARCSAHARLYRHSEAEVMAAMADVDRIRYAAAHRVPAELLAAAAGTGFYIARSPVLMDGRIELLHYFINQSICDSYHRYGNLGERSTI
jgi:RHH-type proline utilization regulon transcriptional repressor/proline dehydrogenase/delta 1-pyrroline-5-carboxylate dehydrogenase